MKVITRKRSRTVQAKTAEQFDKEFEKASSELTEEAELVWDQEPMTVHFIYEERIRIPENSRDELQMKGIMLKCKNCPHREVNPDGRKAGHRDFCPFAFLQQTKAENPACELFCSEVLRGEIRPLED